ncbi:MULTISPECIES: hypothetical protein [Streptomyces]|uniref:hypothetical protein n=1 Tax=Streptomyces TaxID=1883 RepID=UPI000C523E4E|nr:MULTISPECIES: hypothetical protein [Streptomyces]PIB08203.1 hypothetical protein B1C81_14775 [Streptomyces sp. HG99]
MCRAAELARPQLGEADRAIRTARTVLATGAIRTARATGATRTARATRAVRPQPDEAAPLVRPARLCEAARPARAGAVSCAACVAGGLSRPHRRPLRLDRARGLPDGPAAARPSSSAGTVRATGLLNP